MTPGAQRYAEKLARPEWRLRRLEVLERAAFTCQRCAVSGVALEVHHLRYVNDGREPWEYDDSDLECLCVRCHNDETIRQQDDAADRRDPAGIEARGHIRRIIGRVASRLALPPPVSAPRPPEFDAGRAWRWIHQLPDDRVHRPLMKFAGWLWQSGTHDMDCLMAILEDRCRRNPENAFAYYAPGGDARDCRTASVNLEAGARENESFKSADRAFLGQAAGAEP